MLPDAVPTADLNVRPSNNKRFISKETILSNIDEQEKRILHILAPNETDIQKAKRSPVAARKYLEYLKNNIQLPCQLTGLEDFLWEERYVFGFGDEEEYEELKKTNPSYTDTFELIDFKELDAGDDEIIVKVKRQKDGKKFYIGLDWLKAIDKSSTNFQLINDYASWHTNF
jgi:hypothetical protein